MYKLRLSGKKQTACVFLFSVWAALLTLGCKPAPLNQSEVNDGYALLYGLLNDESNVDKLLIVKSAPPEIEELLRAISASAGESLNQMELWQKEDPQIDFTDSGLPQVEQRTRASIARLRTEQLLLHSGEEWQVIVLLTQSEAAAYISHLAKVIAEDESHPQRKETLQQTATAFEKFADQITDLFAVQQTTENAESTTPSSTPVKKALQGHHRH